MATRKQAEKSNRELGRAVAWLAALAVNDRMGCVQQKRLLALLRPKLARQTQKLAHDQNLKDYTAALVKLGQTVALALVARKRSGPATIDYLGKVCGLFCEANKTLPDPHNDDLIDRQKVLAACDRLQRKVDDLSKKLMQAPTDPFRLNGTYSHKTLRGRVARECVGAAHKQVDKLEQMGEHTSLDTMFMILANAKSLLDLASAIFDGSKRRIERLERSLDTEVLEALPEEAIYYIQDYSGQLSALGKAG